MDLLGLLWQKSITLERLGEIEVAIPKALADLERLLPAWELDINRHMVLHLVEGIRQNGPCWTWSMFGFERLWGRLTKWMLQTVYPEATMLNAFKAFKTATTAAPALFNDIMSDAVCHLLFQLLSPQHGARQG